MQVSAITRSGMVPRLAAAAVLMPVAIGLTWAGGAWFLALLLACTALLSREWSRLCGAQPESLPALLLAGGCLALTAGAFLFPHYEWAAIGCILLYFALRRAPAAALSARSRVWLAAGALVVAPAGLSLLWLRSVPADGLVLVLWLLAVIWTTDSAAYLFGKAIGGPRLAPAISPNKTWAGLIGSLFGAGAMGFAFAFAATGEPSGQAAAAAMLIGLAGGAGDLFESFLKRRFSAKDSGGLIPGHGGFLDRLDSILVAAPATVLLYSLDWRWL